MSLPQSLLSFGKKYAILLVALSIGLVLFLWPESGKESPAATGGYEPYPLAQAQQELADALSEIAGAGRVKVVLTLKTDMTLVLQEDQKLKSSQQEDASGKDIQSEHNSTTVFIGASSSAQPIVVRRIYPEFRGALIVCEGAASASVRLAIMDAVSALTGLGTDKISVTAMK